VLRWKNGNNVRHLNGLPKNSVIKGATGRAYLTDSRGKVVLDITRKRTKPIRPDGRWGPKRAPSEQEIKWIDKLWG
jgi:hypothetical protein